MLILVGLAKWKSSLIKTESLTYVLFIHFVAAACSFVYNCIFSVWHKVVLVNCLTLPESVIENRSTRPWIAMHQNRILNTNKNELITVKKLLCFWFKCPLCYSRKHVAFDRPLYCKPVQKGLYYNADVTFCKIIIEY